jgi:hypothetical protein
MKLESFVEDSSYVLNELIVEDLATKDALISLLTDKYSSESEFGVKLSRYNLFL